MTCNKREIYVFSCAENNDDVNQREGMEAREMILQHKAKS
jgi:hypothetical protein